MRTSITLTVYFEDPFWVGLFERNEDEGYTVCKYTFGPEPKDGEVCAFVNQRLQQLHFSAALPPEQKAAVHVNPKRMARQIQKELKRPILSTKAQAALSLERESMKQARKNRKKADREAKQEQLYQMKREKRKEKHRGH